MKAEQSNVAPLLDFRSPDGVRKQTDAEITAVLIGNTWMEIVPGSFHYYFTTGEKPIPFLQFDAILPDDCNNHISRIEVFPSVIGGYAYDIPEDNA